MPLLKGLSGLGLGCVGMILVVVVMLFLSAFFWAWPIMVICGALGWNIGYWPASVLLGLGFSFIAG